MNYNHFNYKQFLLELDKQRNRIIYAKITALRFDESPTTTIEGRVTQGSINLDGDSSVRRTCSLTMLANDFDYSNYIWGLNTKFKLEIGLQNNINPAYPSIIWFNQGIYIISSFNMSRSTSSFSISIQGKDKMCQLNGDLGGSLGASIDFGTMQEVDIDNNIKIIKIPIKDIIRNIVHQYAGEPLHNIIINDIEDYGLELLEYRYDIPMYLYGKANSLIFDNITINGKTPCEAYKKYDFKTNEYSEKIEGINKLSDLTAQELDMLVDTFTGTESPAYIKVDDNTPYYFAKISYGQTAGYRKTELTYPGDLISGVGETITSVLDKIKNMLGNFEYFYDLSGRFVFQKKQASANIPWTPTQNQKSNEQYTESLALATANVYSFVNGELINAFNNNPNLANVRNDYSIWGERTGVSGAKIPIHIRYAIDKKPSQYTTINVDMENNNLIKTQIEYYNATHGTNVGGQSSTTFIAGENCDWREIIFHMAKDFYKYSHILDNFENLIIEANSDIYPTGRTTYEEYYIDLISFWRELYNPDVFTDYDNLLSEMGENPTKEQQEKLKQLQETKNMYYSPGDENQYWNKNVYEAPELLNFWFDFLDTQGELSQFNVKNIGPRTKSINDTNIKSIYFRETPNVIFEKQQQNASYTSGYKSIQINDDSMFSISAQGQSAKNKLDTLIYQHGYCAETATITTIPIYYLQPNSRVYIHDDDTKLDGEYIISKISIPLTYNGTMSLTATKAVKTLY